MPVPLERERPSADQVYRMFYGLKMDTMQIAKRLGIREHEACNLLYEAQANKITPTNHNERIDEMQTLQVVRTPIFIPENNIPIPSRAGKKAGAYSGLIDAIGGLNIGQSIFVPFPIAGNATQKHRVMSGFVSYSRKKFGRKYTTRAVDGGIRIWRTA